MALTRWIAGWKVLSTDGQRTYQVSVSDSGDWGCSCKGWTLHYPRRDCKHIREKKVGYSAPKVRAQVAA